MVKNQISIDDFSFGRLRIDGKDYRDDLLIWEGKIKTNWWRLHSHKVMPDDIPEILQARPDVFVVGSGHSNQLQVDQMLANLLKEQGIRLISEPTEKAVTTFNRLVQEGARVAGAFHLTC